MSDSDTQCPVCGSAGVRGMPFGYLHKDRWLGAHACRDCGIIFLHPQPSAREIEEMYPREYFEGDFRCGHAGSYFDENTLSTLADGELLERIMHRRPGGDLLEVGCAGGAFLRLAREHGYSVKGVEFSATAAEFARTRFGLEVITGDLLEVGFPENAFDLVFMGDVLEHLPDPVSTLREVHRVLRGGGLLVLRCPAQTNTLFSRLGFLLYGALGRRATVHLPPYHLFEYRPRSMRALLQMCGFGEIEVRESLMRPAEITLRGPALQRAGKKLLQYPNYWLTSMFGVLGDRVEVFAVGCGQSATPPAVPARAKA